MYSPKNQAEFSIITSEKNNQLMGHEFNEPVLVGYHGFTEFNVAIVDYWVDVPLLIKLETSFEINVEVFDVDVDITVTRQDPGVDYLVGFDRPVFDSWEVKHDDVGVIGFPYSKLNVFDVQSGLSVFYVLPLNMILQPLRQ
jgi:hypothetical protein